MVTRGRLGPPDRVDSIDRILSLLTAGRDEEEVEVVSPLSLALVVRPRLVLQRRSSAAESSSVVSEGLCRGEGGKLNSSAPNILAR